MNVKALCPHAHKTNPAFRKRQEYCTPSQISVGMSNNTKSIFEEVHYIQAKLSAETIAKTKTLASPY